MSEQNLKNVFEEYKRLLYGSNRESAGSEAVKSVYKINAPYIESNEYREPILMSDGDFVLVFDSGVYKKV